MGDCHYSKLLSPRGTTVEAATDGKVEVEPIEALAAEPSAHLIRVLRIGVFIFTAVAS